MPVADAAARPITTIEAIGETAEGARVQKAWLDIDVVLTELQQGHGGSGGADGMPVSWRHRVIGLSVMERWLPAFTRDGIDLDIMAGAETPYAIPNKYTDFVRHEAPNGMLTGNWRGVGATRNVPAIEGGVDELAHAAGIDPLDYRRRLLQHKPRLLGVLDLAAEKADWTTTLPQGKVRGIALLEDFGSFAAMVSEVSVGEDGSLNARSTAARSSIRTQSRPQRCTLRTHHRPERCRRGVQL